MVNNILLRVDGVGGWEEKRGLKLTSAKVEDEVEGELGNSPRLLSRILVQDIPRQLSKIVKDSFLKCSMLVVWDSLR